MIPPFLDATNFAAVRGSNGRKGNKGGIREVGPPLLLLLPLSPLALASPVLLRVESLEAKSLEAKSPGG